MGNKEIIKEAINDGRTALGIEFGSTRIKAVLVTDTNEPVAQGAHDWENRYENGIWTYSLDDIYTGLRHCYSELREDVKNKYGITLTNIGAIGFSAMMHGYMAFNENDELLVPFRTWRNTITEQASDELTKLFNYHIPQRWSIAHLYQAVLNNEAHVGDIRFITTLAGFIHYKLSGEKVLGVGEASGMFPIDINTKDFNNTMISQFDERISDRHFTWKLRDILPKVLLAGDKAGVLTEEGAKLLDVGCGGGFPCVPIGIVRPDLSITALDSTAKKLDFVAQAAKKLEIPHFSTLCGRAETFAAVKSGHSQGKGGKGAEKSGSKKKKNKQFSTESGKVVENVVSSVCNPQETAKIEGNGRYREQFDVVCARAVARLPVLCELCLPFLRVGAKCSP